MSVNSTTPASTRSPTSPPTPLLVDKGAPTEDRSPADVSSDEDYSDVTPPQVESVPTPENVAELYSYVRNLIASRNIPPVIGTANQAQIDAYHIAVESLTAYSMLEELWPQVLAAWRNIEENHSDKDAQYSLEYEKFVLATYKRFPLPLVYRFPRPGMPKSLGSLVCPGAILFPHGTYAVPASKRLHDAQFLPLQPTTPQKTESSGIPIQQGEVKPFSFSSPPSASLASQTIAQDPYVGPMRPVATITKSDVESIFNNPPPHWNDVVSVRPDDVTRKPTPDQSSWWQRFKSWFSIKHTLDPDDKSFIASVVEKASTIPGKVADELRGLGKSVYDVLSGERLGPELTKFIVMLCDVMILSLSSDPLIWTLMQPSLLLKYGFATGVVIDGIAVFARQLIQRLRSPFAQPETPIAAENVSENSTEYFGISSLFSALYSFTTGMLPTSLPKDTIKSLVALNAGFQLARNIEHFGDYMIKLLKGCVDGIWKLVTGHAFFDQTARTIADEMIDSMLAFDSYYVATNHTHSTTSAAMTALRKSVTLLARGVANGVPKELCDRFEKSCLTFKAWLRQTSPSAEYNDPRAPGTIVQLLGTTSVGKSLCIDFVKAALARAHGLEGDLGNMTWPYRPGLNFQSPPPSNANFMDIDDAWIVMDDERYAEVLELLIEHGSNKPTMYEDPVADLKGLQFLRIMYVFLTDNIIPAHLFKMTTNAPAARRIDGGIHVVKLHDAWIDPHGFLDTDKLQKALNNTVDVPSLLDKVWEFEDHSGYVRPFSHFVAMLKAVRDRKMSRSSTITASINSTRATYVLPGQAVITDPPTDFKRFKGSIKHFMSDSAPASDTEPQSFTCDLPSMQQKAYFAQQGQTDHQAIQFMDRAINFMKSSPDDYRLTMVNNVMTLTKNGAPQHITSLTARYKAPVAATRVNIDVPPSEWTPTVLAAMKGEKFHVFGTCCRHRDYCYVHGNFICDAHDPEAIEVGYVGLSHWACENTVGLKHASYHRLLRDTYAANEESTSLYLLKAMGSILVHGACVFAVAALLNRIVSSYSSTEPQSYTVRAGKKAERTPGERLPRPTFAGVTNQGTSGEQSPPETPTAWLPTKFSPGQIPIRSEAGPTYLACTLTAITSNLGITVRHLNQPGTTHVILGGVYGLRLKFIVVNRLEDVKQSVDTVYGIPDPDYDAMWIVIPKHLPSMIDTQDYWVDGDVELSTLTGCAMVHREYVTQPFDQNMVPLKCEPVKTTCYPLGDADYARTHLSYGATVNAVYVCATSKTPDFSCGQVVFTTNTRVGRGHRLAFGLQTGWSKSGHALITPLDRVAIADAIKRLPVGVSYAVIRQSYPMLLPTDAVIAPQIVTAGELPREHWQFQNRVNNIAASDAYHLLTGVTLYDPVEDKEFVVEEPAYAPSPTYDWKTPFTKVPVSNHIPDPSVVELYESASDKVTSMMEFFADRRLLQPQTDVFPIDQALNGVPHLGIPGLDARKSPGLNQEEPTKTGRMFYLDSIETGNLKFKPRFEAFVKKLVQLLKDGVELTPMVVSNLKEELRMLVTLITGRTVKASRIVNAYDFLTLVALRCFTMHLPGIMASGRLANGQSFGSDLRGEEGEVIGAADRRFQYTVTGDAVKFDGSKSSYVSDVGERKAAYFIRKRFPFLSEAAAMAVARTARIVFVVVGKNVYFSYHGMQSGHPLTTWFNGHDMLSIALGAWLTRFPTLDPFRHGLWMVYGDDLRIRTSVGDFTITDVITFAARLGVTIQDLRKDPSRPGTDLENDSHLQRRFWRDVAGHTRAALMIPVISHIHAFYNVKDKNPKEAQRQIFDSALREWFEYSKRTFDIVKPIFNNHLASKGVPTLDYTYEELYVTMARNKGHMALIRPLAFRKPDYEVQEQSAPQRVSFRQMFRWPTTCVDFCTVPQSQPLSSTAKPTAAAAPVADTASKSTTDSLGDTTLAIVVSPDAQAVVSTTAGVETKTGRTTHLDANAVIAFMASKALRQHIRSPFFISTDMAGLAKELEMEFPIFEVQWPTATGAGTELTLMLWPEDLFGIPYIQNRLAKIRYLRCGVILTYRISQPGFAYGNLTAYWMASEYGSWRDNPDFRNFARNVDISASREAAVQQHLYWHSPVDKYDLLNLIPNSPCGTVSLVVDEQLRWCSLTPATGVTVTISARLCDVQLDGAAINNAPTLLNGKPLSERRRQSLQNHLGLRDKFRKLNTKVDSKTVPQSAPQKEGQDKSQKGVLENASDMATNMESFISQIGDFMEMGMFDKPIDVSSVQPTRLVYNTDRSFTRGMSDGQALGVAPSMYTTKKSALYPEQDPNPSWGKIMNTPALCWRGVVTTSMDSTSNIVTLRFHPTIAYETDPGPPVVYIPGLPALMCAKHKYVKARELWILIRGFSSKYQKCRLRFSWTPDNVTNTQIDINEVGHLYTAEVEFQGDFEYFRRYPVFTRRRMTVVQPPGVPTDDSQHGVLTIDVASRITGNAAAIGDIPLQVYWSYSPDARPYTPIGDPEGLTVERSESSFLSHSLREQVRKLRTGIDRQTIPQSSVRDIWGTPPQKFCDYVLNEEEGTCAQDTTRGPVELCKRFSGPAIMIPTSATDKLWWYPLPSLAFPFDEIVCPWQYVAGGLTYKARPVTNPRQGILTVMLARSLNDSGEPLGLTSMYECDFSVTSTAEWTIPYVDIAPYRNYDNSSLAENDPPVMVLTYAGATSYASGAGAFLMWEAAADDFKVLHLANPPYWHYAAPALKREGKSRSKNMTVSTSSSNPIQASIDNGQMVAALRVLNTKKQ